MEIKDLCINCFQPTGGEEVCMHCGFIQKDKPRQLSHLYPHTVLRGRYIIGTVINNGGLGVVYKAYDLKLETVVAIKEFFPTQNSIASRVPGTTNVIPVNAEREKQFFEYKEKFITEAQTIARFTNVGSIVHIYDIFEENNTAYLVMEYLDGFTLREFMEENSGELDFETALSIILPVMEALDAVHNKNIVFRDVSPDNIFICKDNRVKLIDFSSACFGKDNETDNNDFVKKPGFTPPELYRSKGKVGAYTDVYSVGAVLYLMITGKVPEESIDRQEKDKLESPHKLGINLPSYADKSIMKAMALRENARFKRMDDFIRAVQGKKKANYPEIELKIKKIKRALLVALIFIVLISSVVISYFMKKSTILIPDSETTIELWYQKSGDVDIDNRWDSDGYVSIKKGFSEYADKQNAKIKLVTRGIEKDRYEKELKEAFEKGKGPDIYQTNAGSALDSYSISLNNVYKLFEEEKRSDVFKMMENTFTSKNKIALCYDTPVVYSRNADAAVPDTLEKLSADKKSTKCGLVCNPDSFVYTMNDYENNSNYLGTLSNSYSNYSNSFKDKTFEKAIDNFVKAKNKKSVNHYIGMVSDFPELTKARNRQTDDDKDFGIALLPEYKKSYCSFAEIFSVSKKSTMDEQKSAQLLLCYLLNYQNDSGQSKVTSANTKIVVKNEMGQGKYENVLINKTVTCYLPLEVNETHRSTLEGFYDIYKAKNKITKPYQDIEKEEKKSENAASSIRDGKYSKNDLEKLIK